MKKDKLIIICLSIIVLVSVPLNFVFFSRSRNFYLQLNSLQLNPLAIKYYPANSNPKPTQNTTQKNIVFFGDSRARTWGWITPQGVDNFNFINRGISGQTTAQVLGRFNQHIKPLSPDIVIVQVGVNDLYRIPLFPDRKERIISECKSNIEEMVKQSRQLGTVVILTTMFPFGEVPLEKKIFWSPDIVVTAIKEVNEFIYSLENEDVIIFDTTAIVVNEQGKVRREYEADWLHLNKKGYEVLNQKLIPVLQQLSK